MRAAHSGAVLRIFDEGIATGLATLETEVPSWAEFDQHKLPGHRFVATDVDSGSVIGWAGLSAISRRSAYAGAAEVSVYVAASARGRGAGTSLLAALIASSEAGGIWTLQAGIFPENLPSLALHQRAGFRTVGRRDRIARHGDRWQDVMLLERRSTTVGV